MENSGIIGALIPITLFICIALSFWAYIHYINRGKKDIQLTLRAMIENGQALTPELLEQLGNDSISRRDKDLRRGIREVAFGIALACMAFFLKLSGDANAFFPMLMGASLFLIMGSTYLGLYKFAPNRDKKLNNDLNL